MPGQRFLVKLAPEAQTAPGLAAAGANLRLLYEAAPAAPGAPFGLAAAPAWYLADLPEGGPTAWDGAHAQVAAQLGVDESAVLYAEPDLAQTYYFSDNEIGDQPFALGDDCAQKQQDPTGGKAIGQGFAWHLGDAFSQLAAARTAVAFTDPRTRIAHLDTGYDRTHAGRPERILTDLERNFVDADGQPNSAQDPNRKELFDNRGHGTGTLGILAGGKVAASNDYLGGAPQADILPLRIANRVELFFTSAVAAALQYAIQQRCDVVSLSMGGLPSKAWNEAVNAAYEAGICIVAASGDCIKGLPTHHVVYPARYHRTIAACGVMADGREYYGITQGIEGSWGPDSAMTDALSSYTPNIPWAKLGCATTINLDGAGTSACTPQIAAAAALWYEKYKSVLPRDWRRLEAVRNALFTSALPPAPGKAQFLGRGILRANKALAIAPMLNLKQTQADNDSFAFLRVITGLGLAEEPPREAMFNLELTQRWLLNPALQAAVPDPDAGQVTSAGLRQFMEAAIDDKDASNALRRHLAGRYTAVFGSSVKGAPTPIALAPRPAFPEPVAPPRPACRLIRVYAVDPSFSTRLETASINQAVLSIRWEELRPGPVGEYLEVVDVDAAGKTYPQVDLDAPYVLAQNGLAPAEGNPGFHQQMVYAVAMCTIEHFERALGRPVLWRPRPQPGNEFDDSAFVRQLQIRPHALRQANAYYSPQEVALLFGYFEAAADDPGDHMPGSAVYACLSHDVIAHETTHAVLDGMHRRFNEATNPDVLALHEGFADIVALMQHFTLPEVLESQVRRTRGDLEGESMLGSLAIQFGRASGGRGALRDAIGRLDASGTWQRVKPDPADYTRVTSPHARGAILVAAVFDAFLAIYKSRTADLVRISTGGTGVLPAGAVHPDLVRRLAAEAGKSARHVLNLCIRALDYVPPVDVTFGEFLRGIITADFDLMPEDRYGYRVAFVEAFRRRGIYPPGLNTLSVDTLRWQGIDLVKPPGNYRRIIGLLKRYADECNYLANREALFSKTRTRRTALHAELVAAFAADPSFAERIGLDPRLPFEVHELRRAARVRADGRVAPQIITALTQVRQIAVAGAPTTQAFRGGTTLVVDLAEPEIQYAIWKRVDSQDREQQTAAFIADALRDPLRALLLAADRDEPFALLHGLADIE
ncbi:MAG TPA: S8 family serine peptidase [Thermoanaerobaculia bacterium]|nr:S8 family serine peptidase [Thermoanaerobaculia bacterium]